MVAGVFVYPHLFSTQKTNVSDLLTSDSPTRFLNRLVSVLVAVATLPLWEGLFRHTDLTPSSEKIDLNGGQCLVKRHSTESQNTACRPKSRKKQQLRLRLNSNLHHSKLNELLLPPPAVYQYN